MKVFRSPNMRNARNMRNAIGFSSLGALVLFLGATGVSQEKSAPQSSSPPQEPPAVLKVTTRLVTIDVVARDRHGNAIRDLKQDDFQVFEQAGSHKSAQQIASFRLLDRSLAKSPEVERSALPIPPGVFTNLVSAQKLSAPPTILLVDGLNTDPINELQVRQKMVQLLASAPSDIPVAVFLLGRNLRLLQSFTTDAKLLQQAAKRALSVEGSNLQVKDPRED